MSKEFSEYDYDENEFHQWLINPSGTGNGKAINKIDFTNIEEKYYGPKPLCARKPKYDSDGNEIEDDGYRNPGGGNGRPPSNNPADKMLSVRVTSSQHAKFMALGGSKWLKAMIESAAATVGATSRHLNQ